MELTYEQEDFISDHHRYDDTQQLLDEVYLDMPKEDSDLSWIDDFYKVSEKRQNV
jgi:hypothetical protein